VKALKSLSLLLLSSVLSAGVQAAGCPAGQQQVCLLACFCAPQDAPGLDDLHRLASTGLRDWIVQSRHRLLASGVEPIPLHIRAELEPYFDFAVLDSVRFKVGDPVELNMAHTLMQNPDVSAVTLIDVIVFRDVAEARDDVALWAHELKHVEQYRQLGVDQFAARYARDYRALEAPAYQLQGQVRQALKARAVARQ
jgi:hypothetical protein